MRIPEVQAELRTLALEHRDERLAQLADALARRKPARKASPHSQPMTAELRTRIRRYADEHPAASQVQIGAVFGVNQGRVSEALNGKRR